MPGRSPSKLQGAAAILAVSEVAAALDFYRDVLSFQQSWTYGDPLELASVCRDQVEIHLTTMQRDRFGPSRVYIFITDINAYHKAIAAAGANITVAIADRHYGMRDFRVEDLDGNELNFGEAITP